MIPKSGNRFSEKIMLKQKSMIPKSGNRFTEKIMLKQKGPQSGSRARRLSGLPSEHPDHQQQNHCADDGIDDRRDDAAADNDPDPR
jgi:hypothetical protein